MKIVAALIYLLLWKSESEWYSKYVFHLLFLLRLFIIWKEKGRFSLFLSGVLREFLHFFY
jgi:hypothetical protein